MAENNEKSKKGGAGKFFLGALLGAVAGAIAGKAVSAKFKKLEDDEDFDDCDNELDCGGECRRCKEKDEKIAKLKNEKKAAEKKVEKTEEKIEKKEPAKEADKE